MIEMPSREDNERYQEQSTLPNPLQQRSKKSFEEYAGASNLGGVPSGQQLLRREGVRYPTDKVKSFRSELRPPLWQETHWLGSFKSEEAAMKAFDAALFYTGKLPIHFIYPLNYFLPLPPHLPSIKNREALLHYVKSLARDVSGRKEFKSILKKMAKEASKRTTKLQPHMPQAKLDDMACNIPTVAGIRQFRPSPHFGKSLSPTVKELAQFFPKVEKKAKAPYQESSEGKTTASESLSTSLMDPASGHEDVDEWLSDAPELRPDIMNWLPDRAPSIPSAPSTGDCCSESFLTDLTSHGLLWDTSSSAGEPSVDSAPQQEVPDVGASSLEQVLLPSKGFVLGEEDFNIAEETTSMQIHSLHSFNDDTVFSNYEMQFLHEVLSGPGQ